jgi:thiol-disulfide isomerase/thioredoxin
MKHALNLFLVTASLPVLAAESAWTTDFAAAKASAAESEKSLLVNFTGSDWCGWCIKLKEEVFSHESFLDAAAEDFVLVELDYPQDSSGMSAATIEQNEGLKSDYAIGGYPTIYLMDALGRPYARTGYQRGGVKPYLAHLDELQGALTKRDEAFASARKLEGQAKADALAESLEALGLDDEVLMKSYDGVIDEIRAAAPEGGSAFIKRLESGAKLAEFSAKVEKLAGAGDFEAGLKLADEALAADTFEGEAKQQVLVMKGIMLVESERFDDGLEALEEAKQTAPESPMGQRIDALKKRIEAFRDEQNAAPSEG